MLVDITIEEVFDTSTEKEKVSFISEKLLNDNIELVIKILKNKGFKVEKCENNKTI